MIRVPPTYILVYNKGSALDILQYYVLHHYAGSVYLKTINKIKLEKNIAPIF